MTRYSVREGKSGWYVLNEHNGVVWTADTEEEARDLISRQDNGADVERLESERDAARREVERLRGELDFQAKNAADAHNARAYQQRRAADAIEENERLLRAAQNMLGSGVEFYEYQGEPKVVLRNDRWVFAELMAAVSDAMGEHGEAERIRAGCPEPVEATEDR